MNRTIAQLSLTAVLLTVLAAVCPVANAEDTTSSPKEIVSSTGDAAREMPQILEVSVGARQFDETDTFSNQRIRHPYRILVGRLLPDNSSVARGAGSLGAFEFEYDFKTSRMFSGPTVISVFADLNTNKRYVKNASAEYTMNSVGLGIAARRIFGNTLDRSHTYVGLGVGIFGTGYRIDPFGPARYQKTDYSPAFRVTGGYQFGQSFYIQADYLLLDSFRIRNASGQEISASPSGTRVGLGYRF